MDYIQLNINNLLSLWKTAAHSFNGYFESGDYAYTYLKEMQWPKKIWLHKRDDINHFSTIADVMTQHDELVFSHFTTDNTLDLSVTNNELALKFTQHGMHLPLKQRLPTTKSLQLKMVECKSDAKQWSWAFQQAFGYVISPETIENTKHQIPYLLAYHKNELVGTIILYQTNNVMGIHALGILPHMRKKGYATEIMCHALNKTFESGVTLATLQASQMALNMYKHLGFIPAFYMQNYQLKTGTE